ncbi:MAG: hypothetical protein ACP5N9_06100 [Candidatus Bilamarchaeum sp.]|jgi:hypothetical protein
MEIKKILQLFSPLLIIPITFYAVSNFGHVAGNVVIGLAFFVCLLKFTKNVNEKRLMILLSIFITLFEKVSIAIGSYSYLGLYDVPMWISLGWSVAAIYLLRNAELFRNIDRKVIYAAAVLIYLILWAFQGFRIDTLIPSVFTVLGIYVVSRSSSLPDGFFLFTSLIGILIEYCGTQLRIWSYFNQDGSIMAVPLAALGLVYVTMITFGLWISHVE